MLQRNGDLSFGVTVWQDVVFRHADACLTHGTAIAVIAVCDTAGGVHRTYEHNIPMPHLQEIVHHGIHPIIAVGDHAVPVIPCIKGIQHHQRNPGLCQHFPIRLREIAHDNNAVHPFFLHQPWNLPLLLGAVCHDLQDADMSGLRQIKQDALIQVPIERLSLFDISV